MVSYALKVIDWFKLPKPASERKNSLYLEGWEEYDKDPFDLEDNPKGVIQMILVENQPSVDSIVDWITTNLKPSICSVEGIECSRRITNFQDYHGMLEFISGIAKFTGKNKKGNVKFDPKPVAMAGGATGANEIPISCFANSGDTIFVPVPYYPGYVVYSINDKVVNCVIETPSSGLVSTQTQYLLTFMLSDDEFIEKFITENKKKLKERHEKFTRELEKFGIKCLESNAGVYCWVNLRCLLKEPTLDAERSLWRLIIREARLNISPGSSFSCPEVGWFRICFANIDDIIVDIALARILKFVDPNNKSIQN